MKKSASRSTRPLQRLIVRVGLGDLLRLSPRDSLALALVLCLTFFLFGDQNLIASNLPRIGRDLGFPEPADYLWYIGGLPAAGFFVLGGLVSMITGPWADRSPAGRARLVATAVLVGEGCCLLTGFAPDYASFLLLRMGTGFGAGGVFPVLFSLLADYFRPANRPTAAALVGLAMGLGIGAGQFLAGLLAHVEFAGIPGWRLAFILMAAPAFPLVLVYLRLNSVPLRGGSDRRGRSNRGSAESATRGAQVPDGLVATAWSQEDLRPPARGVPGLLRVRTNVLVFLQGIPGTVPWGFVHVYFVEYYESLHGFTVLQANIVLVAFGFSALFGGLFGGLLGRWLYRHARRWLPVACGATVIGGIAPLLFLIHAPTRSLPILLAVAGVAGLIVPMTGANVRAILANVNRPSRRGAAFALYNLTDDLGRGLGPFFVGLLLLLGAQLFPEAPRAARLWSANLAVGLWLLSGIAWFFMAATMVQDEERARLEAERETVAAAGEQA